MFTKFFLSKPRLNLVQQKVMNIIFNLCAREIKAELILHDSSSTLFLKEVFHHSLAVKVKANQLFLYPFYSIDSIKSKGVSE